MDCPRCDKPMQCPESCWYCQADLCYECWDAVGHCGHPEADRINAVVKNADGFDERHAVMMDFLDRTRTHPFDYEEEE